MVVMGLNIGMIDVDLLNNGTRHPNLAQMKMSAYCQERGHSTELIYLPDQLDNLDSYDVLLVSKVFNFTKVPFQLQERIENSGTLKELNSVSVSEILDVCEAKKPNKTIIQLGGTGFFVDGGNRLEMEIELHFPDYNLYTSYVNYMVKTGKRKKSYFLDYTNCFIGFVTRGCPRKCGFCVLRFNPGCKFHAHPSTFVNPSDKNRKRILLWDDNILAYPKCNEVFDQLDSMGLPFQFRQGLDIRFINNKNAERINKCHYYGDFIFAFDHWKDRDIITKKLDVWRTYCKKETKLYVLTGYDARCVTDLDSYIKEGETVDEKDRIDILHTFLRVKILLEHQCLPYIMRYEDYKISKYRGMYTQLARWCNQPSIFKKMSFREFIERNLLYVKGEECASTRALKIFLNDYPDFPEELLDMKWTDYIGTYIMN